LIKEKGVGEFLASHSPDFSIQNRKNNLFSVSMLSQETALGKLTSEM
jgi:hypothetical protein